jgi:hypothetical protein
LSWYLEVAVPKLPLSTDYLKIADGVGRPLNYFSACCLTTVMRCAVGAKDEIKEVGTVLNLFSKYLDTSMSLIYGFLLMFS